MNKYRIYSLISLLITMPGFYLLSLDRNYGLNHWAGIFGLILIGAGFVPGILFILKARQEEQ